VSRTHKGRQHADAENGVSNGFTQAQLLEAIGAGGSSWGDMRIWGAVYSHRQACVRYLRDAVLKLLDDPTMTRRRLRAALTELAKQVEEHGPPDGEPSD
jgi:hypothetical protein